MFVLCVLLRRGSALCSLPLTQNCTLVQIECSLQSAIDTKLSCTLVQREQSAVCQGHKTDTCGTRLCCTCCTLQVQDGAAGSQGSQHQRVQLRHVWQLQQLAGSAVCVCVCTARSDRALAWSRGRSCSGGCACKTSACRMGTAGALQTRQAAGIGTVCMACHSLPASPSDSTAARCKHLRQASDFGGCRYRCICCCLDDCADHAGHTHCR